VTESNELIARRLLEGGDQAAAGAPEDPAGPKSMEALLESKDSKVKALESRVLELRRAEEAGDIAWMGYTSWFCSGHAFQGELRSLVDPVFWGSAYFEHARFVRHLPALMARMSPTTHGTLLRSGGRYQVLLHNERHPHRDGTRKDAGRGDELMTFTRDGVQDVRDSYHATLRDLSKPKDKKHR
jgi:hypothetical protein